MAGLPLVDLDGTRFERGEVHGVEMADEIAHNVETYLDVFADRGVDPDDALALAEGFLPRIERDHPGYAEEMRGVAAGSDRTVEEVTMINVRYEVLYNAYSDDPEEREQRAAEASDGCTSFAVQPERSADGHTYVGQNWDWLPDVETFFMRVRQADAPDFLALTEAGMVGGKFGLNEAGVGFAVNGLATPEDGEDPFRTPTHVRGRRVLGAPRLDLAFEPIVGSPRPGSRNWVVASDAGDVVDFETAPDHVFYRYPEDGLLTHANHFETDGVESIIERESPHSLVRARRLRRLLDRHERIGVPELTAALRDDTGAPMGICRYATDVDDSQAPFHTKTSIVMDLDERRLVATDGPPKNREYVEYAL
ncbi:MAG: C45 family autoproteolytic acyltransferase/hydrolase [Haloarculaceae archaeon]